MGLLFPQHHEKESNNNNNNNNNRYFIDNKEVSANLCVIQIKTGLG